MCWDEYKQFKAALSDKRERTSSELRYVLTNRVRMNPSQRASAEHQRARFVAALPPLPPEPYEIRTTFSSNHTTLRERLLLPYYTVLCSTILLLLPLSVLITVIHQCLIKVGLWPYIEKAFRNLLLSPFYLLQESFTGPFDTLTVQEPSSVIGFGLTSRGQYGTWDLRPFYLLLEALPGHFDALTLQQSDSVEIALESPGETYVVSSGRYL
jgi:hypothetical protein